MSDETPAESIPYLASGDAPWSGNPQFTRKEASLALRQGHPPMTPELAQQIAAELLAGKSPKEIAEQFGYAKSYASKIARAPAVQSRVQAKIAKLMDKAGLTLEDQIQKLKQLQGAEKVVTASKDGIITDERTYADGPVRLKALEVGLDLHSAFPNKRQYEGPERGARFVIQIGPEFKNIFFGAQGNPDGSIQTEEVEEE